MNHGGKHGCGAAVIPTAPVFERPRDVCNFAAGFDSKGPPTDLDDPVVVGHDVTVAGIDVTVSQGVIESGVAAWMLADVDTLGRKNGTRSRGS